VKTAKGFMSFYTNPQTVTTCATSLDIDTAKKGHGMIPITHHDLSACLSAVAPCELVGMTLLRQGSPHLVPPDIPRDVLREAVTEIIAYTQRCAVAAQRLRDLAPIPLMNLTFAGYAL
jgi:hypothetical protein